MLCSNICDNDGARRTGWVVWRGRLYRIETCRAGTATPSGQWSPTAPALAGQDHKFRTGIEAEASNEESIGADGGVSCLEPPPRRSARQDDGPQDRKSKRLNSSH